MSLRAARAAYRRNGWAGVAYGIDWRAREVDAKLRNALFQRNIPLPRDIVELTVLRFFAAAWVLVLHFSIWAEPPLVGAGALIESGDYAVDLFFILSGFVLCHVYRDPWREGRFAYLPFLKARLARIYPLHVLTALVMLGLMTTAISAGLLDASVLWGDYVWVNLALAHAWGVYGAQSLNGPSWSISAEWAAYLAFPAFLWVSAQAGRRPRLFLAFAFATLIVAVALLHALGAGRLNDQIDRFALVRIAPGVMIGCVLFAVCARVTLRREALKVAVTLVAAAMVLAAHFDAHDLVMVPLLAAIVFLCAQRAKHADPSPARLPGLAYLGEASFALYMVHWPVFFVMLETRRLSEGLEYGAIPLAEAAPALAVAFALAILLHEGIERPARDAIRRIETPARAPFGRGAR